MATKPTSRPGRSEGYILLDALLAALLAAMIASAVLPGLALAARRSAEHFERTIGSIAERSDFERGEAVGRSRADGREAR